MDPVVDQAICLRQWDYSETSQTAVLFGRSLGIVRVLGKGSKRNDPRFSGGLEVCTVGEAVVYPKETGLAVLAGWDLTETLSRSRSSLASYYAAMLALEAPRLVLSEAEAHPAAFDALLDALRSLDEATWPVVLARWLWRLLDDAGYRPEVAGRDAAAFSPGGGRLVDVHEAQRLGDRAWPVLASTAEGLRRLASGDPLDPADAVRVGRLLCWYLRELGGHELNALEPVYGPFDPSRAHAGRLS
ncbi:MAG: DNA repair protein RecO [Phycisphaerales bacterium]